MTKVIVQNKQVKDSVFGYFHKNFDRFYLRMNSKLLNKSSTRNLRGLLPEIPDDNLNIPIGDQEYQRKQTVLLHSVFRHSDILKKDVEKVILYFNLPEYLIRHLYLPTKLFPGENSEQRFPEATKIVDYFSKKKFPTPNLFIFELVVKMDPYDDNKIEKFVVAAFSKKGWKKEMVIDRQRITEMN